MWGTRGHFCLSPALGDCFLLPGPAGICQASLLGLDFVLSGEGQSASGCLLSTFSMHGDSTCGLFMEACKLTLASAYLSLAAWDVSGVLGASMLADSSLQQSYSLCSN